MFSSEEKEIIRNLARRVAELADDPVNEERKKLWKDYNSLRPTRPMILCYPECGWADVIPDSDMKCRDKHARSYEWKLRMRIAQAEDIRDDQVTTRTWHVGVHVDRGDFGMKETRFGNEHSKDEAWAWEPPLKDPADVRKLHIRDINVRWDLTEKARLEAEELFGDILDVRVDRAGAPSGQFANQLIMLRGNDELLYDMYDRPGMLRDILDVLLASALNELKVLEKEDALRLNNQPDNYCGTGGVGLTDELPGEGFDGHVRPRDLWCVVENQEYTGVSPEHVYEFGVKHEAELAKHYGLVYYGCCEPIHEYLDMLKSALPNMRACSIAPWCDREVAAEKLGDEYLYYWKPNPALTCAPDVNWETVEDDIRKTLDIAGDCRLAMVLKDTHTFAGDSTRPGKWVSIARKAVEEYAAVAV